MQRGLLAGGFAIAAIPYAGLVGTGVRYAARSHSPDALPSWYGLIFAAAALVVTGLFAAAALAAAGRAFTWGRLLRATLIAFPLVAAASLLSLPLLAGMVVLLFALWVLRKRQALAASRLENPPP